VRRSNNQQWIPSGAFQLRVEVVGFANSISIERKFDCEIAAARAPVAEPMGGSS
jgi:hypothetical protein